MEEGECGIKRQREGGGGGERPTNDECRPVANRHPQPGAAAQPGEGQDDQPAKPSNQHSPEEAANIGKVGALSRRKEWLVTKRGIKGPVCEEIPHQGV
jgi:hypothetical protein